MLFRSYLPLAQQFFGRDIKSSELKNTVERQTKDEFIENALRTFNTKNVGKYVSSKDRLQAEQTINALADSLYGKQTNSVTQSQTQNNAVTWLKSQNIVTQDQLNNAVRELRSKNWTDDQINSALDEVGL